MRKLTTILFVVFTIVGLFVFPASYMLPDVKTLEEKIALLLCLASITGLFLVVLYGIETADYKRGIK
jgi:hypothetical protein